MYPLQAEESSMVQEAVIADKIGFSCTAEELGIFYVELCTTIKICTTSGNLILPFKNHLA